MTKTMEGLCQEGRVALDLLLTLGDYNDDGYHGGGGSGQSASGKEVRIFKPLSAICPSRTHSPGGKRRKIDLMIKFKLNLIMF